MIALNGAKKNFVADSAGSFRTVFCNKDANKFSAQAKKYNLGTVCVSSQKAYDALKLDSENFISALIYTDLKKSGFNKWSYRVSGKGLSVSSSEWGTLVEKLYAQVAKNSAYTVVDSKLNSTECKFFEKVAAVWVNTIQPPLNKGLNEYSSEKYEMTFKVGKHNCILSCKMDSYGSYAVNGTVYLSVDSAKAHSIGMVSAGSYENFKAQAAVYIVEGYLKEYYQYATDKVVKKVTEKNNTAKVAGQFLEKIIKKTCFQSLNSTKTKEVKEIVQAFDIKKYFGKAL